MASVELAPGRSITTTTFDGQLPGPLLRGTVGQSLRVDVYNETDTVQRVNWHGVLARGAGAIEPGCRGRMEVELARPGLFFYHSGLIAANRLDAGLYSGLVGGLLVEGVGGGGHVDGGERVVVLKESGPFIHRTGRGYEVGYESVTANGRLTGPATSLAELDMRAGTVLHVLNASATSSHSVQLPEHAFEVLALDGFAVARRAIVTNLSLAPGERVTARVRSDAACRAARDWDYSLFGAGNARHEEPDARVELVLNRHAAPRSGFNRWSINGNPFCVGTSAPLLRLMQGIRYRLTIRNTSDEPLPLHLQHHRLRIAALDGRPAGHVLKDVICVAPNQLAEVDFMADNPRRGLLYCTRQLQRDFGLMALVDYM
jgi:FtsP/CotA-like multicopper oxidase with cupredoxin domain